MKADKTTGPLPFFFPFEEESDYGEEIMELLAMVNELTYPDEVYNKIDVRKSLTRIEEKVRRIKFDFFRGIIL